MNSLQQKKSGQLLKYTLVFFSFLIVYSFVFVNRFQLRSVGSADYTYYLLDYSFGFCTQVLPGAVYHLFFKEANLWQVNLFVGVIVVGLFAFVSFLLGKLMVAQENKPAKKNMLVFIVLFMTGCLTFCVFTKSLGIIDMFFAVFAAIFIGIISNKYFRFFIPAVVFLCLLIYASSILTFVFAFIALLLYQTSQAEGPNQKQIYGIITLVSIFVAVGTFFYFCFFEKSNLTYDYSGFLKQLEARNKLSDVKTDSLNLGIYLYNRFDYHGMNMDYFVSRPLIHPESTTLPLWCVNCINYIYCRAWIMLYEFSTKPEFYISMYAIMLMASVPLLICFYRYWILKIKNSCAFMNKLPFILLIIHFPLCLLSFLFLIGFDHFYSANFLMQFASFFYIIHKEKDYDYLQKSFITQLKLPVLCYYIACYGMAIIDVR